MENFLVGVVVRPVKRRRISVDAPNRRQSFLQVIVPVVIREFLSKGSLVRVTTMFYIRDVEQVLKVSHGMSFTATADRGRASSQRQ